MDPGVQRRAADWRSVFSYPVLSLHLLVVGVICLFFQGAVGVESFTGAFFEKDLVVAEEMVDFIAFVDGDEENFSLALAPDFEEILRGEEDWWGVGEGATEEHGGRAAIDERDVSTKVEGNGGAVGLVAVEEDFVRA